MRRAGELAPVASGDVAPSDRRIQYWMLNGVSRVDDSALLRDRSTRYELTYMADRLVGSERPKAIGHRHPQGHPEVCEVLNGRGGFLIQDLLPGPSASFAVLVEVGPGDRVVLPPWLFHTTLNLEGDPLVFSDVVDRAAGADYRPVLEARGFAYFVMADGAVVPNPAYREVSGLIRVAALDWSGRWDEPLYTEFVRDGSAFDWLSDTTGFEARFPEIWERVRRFVP